MKGDEAANFEELNLEEGEEAENDEDAYMDFEIEQTFAQLAGYRKEV